MNQWNGPRPARPEEFAEAMRFTDMVFRPGQSGRRIVQRQYPHAYRDSPAFARRLLLLRDGTQLVGCVAVHPMAIRLGAATLKAGGIGIVGTHPERRGEGIMTTLLQDAIGRMQKAGCAVSVLGGDRQRYGRFGWENAGVRIVHHLTARSLGAPSPAERRLSMQRLVAEEPTATLAQIRRLSAQRPVGVVRAAGDMASLLRRNGKETWTCRVGRRFAYVVIGGPHRRARPYTAIHEFGGDSELTLALWRRLLLRAPDKRLSVVSGPNGDEQSLLTPVSATWFRLADGMTQVLDVTRVIEQLQPELDRRARELKISAAFELQIRGIDGQMQQADLQLHGGARSRTRVSRSQGLKFDQLELVEFLFGCVPLAERFGGHAGVPDSALATLSTVLPLPLHIPSLNHI